MFAARHLKPQAMKTIIEPFKIKSVEPIRFTTRQEREDVLRKGYYNLFLVPADDVLIDLLTDSGTAAMSAEQWAGMMRGDESYAGARSFFRFEAKVRELTGFRHIIPTHQGRAAERILFSLVGGKGKFVPNNSHFDTTRANVEFSGTGAVDLPTAEGQDPDLVADFKGNMDTQALEGFIARTGAENIPLCMITVTNNSGGGQPVSMRNIRETKAICAKHGIPLFLDACRFAENAAFIKKREAGYDAKPMIDIVKEMFSYADGATMSAKKDGMVNIGGFIVLRSDEWMEAVRNLEILTEGFPTYGGLAGRDLEAMAVGLQEGMDEDYLRYRLRTAEYLGERLDAAGIGFVRPTGGHAVYIDARTVLPEMPVAHYPAWALCNALYLEGGIRGVEIGSVMFGRRLDDGQETFHSMELVRLAFPRRMYTQSHFDYAAEVIADTKTHAASIRGMRIVRQPKYLRHFSCECAWV